MTHTQKRCMSMAGTKWWNPPELHSGNAVRTNIWGTADENCRWPGLLLQNSRGHFPEHNSRIYHEYYPLPPPRVVLYRGNEKTPPPRQNGEYSGNNCRFPGGTVFIEAQEFTDSDWEGSNIPLLDRRQTGKLPSGQNLQGSAVNYYGMGLYSLTHKSSVRTIKMDFGCVYE